MSYTIMFSRENEKVFKGVRALIQDIKSKTGTSVPQELILELEQQLDIKLGRSPYYKEEGGYPHWELTFPDEQAYVYFLLRWS